MNKAALAFWVFMVFIIVIAVSVGISFVVTEVQASVIPDDDGRPIVPQINTYGFPPGSLDGEAAECASWNNCGVLCFYIYEGEGYSSTGWELSCIPWSFDLGSPLGEGQGK